MTKSNGTTLWRLCELEKRVTEVSENVDKILENHLPHIQISMQELRGFMSSLEGKVKVATAINVGAIATAAIIGIVLQLFLRGRV